MIFLERLSRRCVVFFISPTITIFYHSASQFMSSFFNFAVLQAVSLRLESTANSGVERKLTGSENPILELTAGDQLEKENLEQALVEVNMKSLYSSSDVDLGSSSEVAQLYFGPGFEDRLEIELDE